MIEKQLEKSPKRGPLIVLGALGVMALLAMVGEDAPVTQEPVLNPVTELSQLPSDSLPEEIRLTMTDYEIMLYNQNPSSMGFPPEDLMFLQEHGVSPEEARAAETVMRKEGILSR
jgi:hypothetical protein